MNSLFENIRQVIEQRRTVKPPQMNGQRIPGEQVKALLALADWAPTHGYTEPWRFRVYAGEKVQEFCQQHATLYKQHVNPEQFMEFNYEKLLHMGDKASHILIAYMKRGSLPKIPALEEIAAASCAIQNLLLGATALGIASYWGSGGMAYKPAMKDFLGLGEEDTVLGILYLGYADGKVSEGKRTIALSEKVEWVQ